MSTIAEPVKSAAAFANEPVADFSKPANREAMERALREVRAQFGREYELLIAGRREKTGDQLKSLNPSRPSEIVGVHNKATAALAKEAVEAAHAYFPEWSAVPAVDSRRDSSARGRVVPPAEVRVRRVAGVRSGQDVAAKPKPTSREAIDFLRVLRAPDGAYAKPDPLVQLPGENGRMVYLPLGVGVIIPPWNFPLAIMVGMTTAALVAGNTVVIKPSSDTPTIAAKFAEVLRGGRFPGRGRFSLLVGSGAVVGDVLVEHPQTRFVAFTGSQRSRAADQRTGGASRAGAALDQAGGGGDGRQGRHRRGREADLDEAVKGVWSVGVRISRGRSARRARGRSWTRRFTTSSLRS